MPRSKRHIRVEIEVDGTPVWFRVAPDVDPRTVEALTEMARAMIALVAPTHAEVVVAHQHAERERWRYEYQALGAAPADIDRFEALVTRIAQRTVLPNHRVIEEGWVLGKRRLALGDTLLPGTDEREAWVRALVQSMLLGGALTLDDPYGIYAVTQTALGVLEEEHL